VERSAEIVARALGRVADQTALIVTAHEELGVPLEDLLCQAIRKAFLIRYVDLRQSELPLDGKRGGPR
jgi:phosphosulfolactate phosphohydrolase-like enzyme